MGSMRSVWEAWKVKGNCMGSLLEVLEGNWKDVNCMGSMGSACEVYGKCMERIRSL